MGSCEIARGSAGALRAAVGVVLLGLGLSVSAPPQTACAPAAALQSLPQPEYHNTDGIYSGVAFLKPFVRSFLHSVQPNPFPADLISKTIRDFEQVLSNQELIKEALVYEVGFLVCAAIGILYIVLMPIVGFFLACCRCCGNCGGKMYQMQTSSIQCRRRALYWSLFVTTCIILAGNICMFRSNEALHVSVDQSPPQLNATIDNIHSFLTAVPQQMSDVVNASHKTIQEVTRNLDDIGPQLGKKIQERFMLVLGPALQPVRRLNQETVDISVQLNELNSSLVQLQSSMSRVQANVTAVKKRINQTLSKPSCVGCALMKSELNSLTLGTSVTIPSLDEFKSAVDEVVQLNLPSKIKEVEDQFDSLPQTVINKTKDVVQKSKQLLADIRTQISQFSSEIPLSGLTKMLGTLDRVHGQIDKVSSEVTRAERIRWSVCAALCCAVLLVVVCNLLGLVLGPLGLRPKADPTKRSCTANCGGTFFMMGAGFSFLFSWLLMIVVLLLFLLGGNIYTMICRPWNNGQLLKFVDSSGLVPDIGQTLGLTTNISLSDIYSDCEENKPLWATLHLNEIINLDEFLNVSKYTAQIQKKFEDTTITLSTFTLLSPAVKGQLSSFSAKANSLDSAAITQQINGIAEINLNTTADRMESAPLPIDPANRAEFRTEAGNLRQIQASIETTIIPQLEAVNSTVERLRSLMEKINGTVGEVLRNVGAAQDFLNTNTTQIVKTESRSFLDCQMGYFVSYADWANLTVTQQVGRCQPVAGALHSVEIILCSNLVASLNAFWFSLGWCMIFLIPSIIFSIKLAKYYRKMNSSDVYDEHIVMNHIPRAQMHY